MRLDRFVCKSTELTKSEANQRIELGQVSINGEISTNVATQVHESNTVMLAGERLKPRDFRYILMHKPVDTICSNVDEGHPSLFNYLKVEKASELHIAGRLDTDTTGLVLITDDGRWSFNITQPSRQCRKVYRVTLSKEITSKAVSKLENGVQLQGEDHQTLPATLEIVNPNEVLLTITEGKYHQVKRMFAAVGNRVVALHREQIGDVRLDVDVGKWRFLTESEVNALADSRTKA